MLREGVALFVDRRRIQLRSPLPMRERVRVRVKRGGSETVIRE
jgi:hypothetical protein